MDLWTMMKRGKPVTHRDFVVQALDTFPGASIVMSDREFNEWVHKVQESVKHLSQQEQRSHMFQKLKHVADTGNAITKAKALWALQKLLADAEVEREASHD